MWMIGWPLVAMLLATAAILVLGAVLLIVGGVRLGRAERWLRSTRRSRTR